MMELHPEILRKDGAPQFAILPYDEFVRIEEALRRLAAGIASPDPRYGGFWDNLSAGELAQRQGVKPITDLSELAWPYGSEDWDGFEEAVEQWRNEHPVK
jgi:hypothetical protein